LDDALPLRQLPQSDVIADDNMDFRAARGISLQDGHAPLFCIVAGSKARLLRNMRVSDKLGRRTHT
jgi:hypothetical protein